MVAFSSHLLYNRGMTSKSDKNIFVTGSDGLEYEYMLLSEALNRLDDPIFQKIEEWQRSVRPAPKEKFYFNPDVIDRIDNEIVANNSRNNNRAKYNTLMSFSPPVLNLTIDDFFDFTQKEFSKISELKNPTSRNEKLEPRLARADGSTYCRNSWRESIVADRSYMATKEYMNASGNYSHYSIRDAIYGIFEKEWRAVKRKAPNHAIEIIKLNHYLYGEGKTFNGSFEEWLKAEDIYSDTMRNDLDRFEFNELEVDTLLPLVLYGRRRHVGSIEGVTKKSRNLLIEKDQKVWKLVVERSTHHAKGKDFDALNRFLSEIEIELGRAESKEIKVLSVDEIRKEYVLMIAHSLVSETADYNPKLIFMLSRTANELLSYIGEDFLLEHSQIINTVKSVSVLSGKTMSLKQVLGLLTASHSKTWIRSQGDNGIFLMKDIIDETKSLDILNLIYEIVFDYVTSVPTETEWRNSINEISFSLPAEMLLTLVCSPAAMEKQRKTSYAPAVQWVRDFNIKGEG